MTSHGRCLCGAVTVTVTAPMTEISACHCDNCRRWGGGVQFGIAVPANAVTFAGPVKEHLSSRIAKRAWCDTCGSALYLRDVEGPGAGEYELCPGLFDNAGGARLVRAVYADRAVGRIELAGALDRVTRQDYEAENPHLSMEGQDDRI